MTTRKFTQNMIGSYNEGSTLAESRFYDTYRPEVMLKVQETLQGLPGTEDLVNDIFCKFFKKKLQFDTLRSMEKYLRRMIWSMCRDFKKREKTPVIKMDWAREHYQKIEERAARYAEIKMTARVLHDQANQMLSPQCREVFILYYIRDIRVREIAKMLNISERTVHRHLEIAVLNLRKEVQKDGGQMYMIHFLLPLLWGQMTS
jgi:RNA polymerase sigma-70 factor (ECF subfamily)